MVKLKKCPFCGGYGKLAERSRTVVKGETVRNTYVRCVRCDARGERFLYREFDSSHDAHMAAIEAWNRRVTGD